MLAFATALLCFAALNASFAVGPGLEIAGEYTLLRLLGEGGMGAVYVARQKSTGKERALKIMHREIVADPSLTKRFEQEARVASRIQSEHVVDVLAAGVDDATGIPFLVMELLEGEDVRSRLSRGPLSRAEAVVVLEQLCHAIGAAHAGGVVHRDLKPENVFLARERRAGSSGFVVKVLDFGIAKIASAATRSTRGALGSPMWMAPEQTSPGPITPAADVWALGLFAFEILTAKSFWRAPYDAGGTTAQLLREIVLDPIPLASARALERGAADLLPSGFDAWFARCLAREPAGRFATGADAWAAFRAAVLGTSALATTQDASEVSAVASWSATVPDGGSSPPRPVVVRTPLADETGEATAFQVPAESAVSPAPVGVARGGEPSAVAREVAPHAAPAAASPSDRPHLRPETPIVSVREPTPAPPRARGSSRTVASAVVVALAVGIGAGAFLATRGSKSRDPHEGPDREAASASLAATVAPSTSSAGGAGSVAPSLAVAPSGASAVSTASATSASTAPAGVGGASVAVGAAPAGLTAAHPAVPASATGAGAPSSLGVPAASTPTTPGTSSPRRTAGGFSSPVGERNASTWRVQDRPVRVLSRLVSNDSNVADKVVRAAIDWNAWQYLRCYEQSFKGAKDLPDGVVTIGFDILDQLPRHAALVSSTITSDAFNKCVVGTLLGQTINAAGPDGKGHAVYAFQFVAN